MHGCTPSGAPCLSFPPYPALRYVAQVGMSWETGKEKQQGEIQGARLSQHWKNHGVSRDKQIVQWREPGKLVSEKGMLAGEARGGKREGW